MDQRQRQSTVSTGDHDAFGFLEFDHFQRPDEGADIIVSGDDDISNRVQTELFHIPIAGRKDIDRGLCFVGKRQLSEFLRHIEVVFTRVVEDQFFTLAAIDPATRTINLTAGFIVFGNHIAGLAARQ